MSIISLHAVLWPAASSPRRISEDGQPIRDAGPDTLYDRDLHPAPVPFNRSTSAFISRHERTRIYTPRHNGKIERYQRLMSDECLYAHAFYSEGERREAISVWVHHYNYCESWGGWSGTGWQGERRAASAPRPWLLQLFAPIGCVSMDMSGSGVGWPALARPTPMA